MASQSNVRDEAWLGHALFPIRMTFRWILQIFLLYSMAMVILLGWVSYHAGASGAAVLRDTLIQTHANMPNQVLGGMLANALYAPLFEWTSIDKLMREPPSQYRLGLMPLLYPYVLMAMYASKLIGLRLAQLASGMVVLMLILMVALVDGLVARRIRQVTADRESASWYHRAKHLRVWCIPLGALIYCASPIPFDPFWIIGPLLIALTWSIRTQAKYLKKYL